MVRRRHIYHVAGYDPMDAGALYRFSVHLPLGLGPAFEENPGGLKRIGYQGYLASEYCLPVIRNPKIAGVEEVDKATFMAMRYMKKLIAEAG